MDRTLIPLFDEFRKRTATAGRIVLTTHINPDGDGLGSMVALADLLRTTADDVRILQHSAVPTQYRFLDSEGTRIVRFDAAAHADLIRRADLVLIVDTNHPDRLASMADEVRRRANRTIIVDHHPDPDPSAGLSIVDTDACATGEIVFRLLRHLGHPLTPATANALYVAIMTDTGSFRYPKTDGDVHRIVADLLDAGADPVSAYQQVYEQGPPNRLRLLAEVLATLGFAHDGRVAYLTVTREMFARTGTDETDTDAFVPYTLSVAGVRVGLMFSELPDGSVKVNFRSKGPIAVNAVARMFGGNGHANAAGARVSGRTISDLIPDVVARCGGLFTQESR